MDQEDAERIIDAIEELRSSIRDAGLRENGAGRHEDMVSEVKILQKSVDLLQNKMDKTIRQLDSISEAQKKNTKLLQGLLKTFKAKPVENEDSDVPISNKSSLASATLAKCDSVTNWANNVLLVGDGHWLSLKRADDVSSIINQLDAEVNFRIIARQGETLDRLYDEQRDKILFALPPRVTRVAISIGSQDLLQDREFLTLKDASLDEVRRRNRDRLKRMAFKLFRLIRCLVEGQKKTVVLLIPPLGEEKIELFKHWEEIVLEENSSYSSAMLKIIDLPDAMRITDFSLWLDKSSKHNLSDYGIRRLFDLLQKALSSRDTSLKSTGQELPTCYRCLRNHPGGEAECKSRDRACSRCGLVGHFSEIHDVTSRDLQLRICRQLGIDIFANEAGPASRKRPESDSQSNPDKRLRSSSFNGTGENEEAFDDWYAE